MMSKKSPPLTDRAWISVLVFAILFLGVALGWLASRQSPPRLGQVVSSRDYSVDAMNAALDPANIAGHREQIEALGRRLPGDPGHTATAQWLGERWRALGYEVIERTEPVVAPVVEKAAILSPQGEPLPGVEIHPFWPNHFQPMATHPEGVRGKLVLLDEETIRRSPGFAGMIGVVDINNPPAAYGLDWVRYAQLGVEALILASREEEVDWLPLYQENRMVSSLPVNFVRVFARGPLWEYLDEEVQLDVRQSYRPVDNKSVVAILRADQPSREALLLTAGYGSYGVLPTLPNAEGQAWFPATLMGLAEGFAAYRPSLTRDIILVADGSEIAGQPGESSVISAIGPQNREAETAAWLSGRLQAHQVMQERAGAVLALFADEEFLLEWSATREALDSLARPEREFLDSQLRFVMLTEVFERGENVLQAKLDLDRAGKHLVGGPLFDKFQSTLAGYNRFQALSSIGMERLFERRLGEEVLNLVRNRLDTRMSELARYHASGAARAEADLRIHEAAQGYEGIFVLAPRLLPGGAGELRPALAIYPGEPPAMGVPNRQAPLLNALVSNLAQQPEFVSGLEVAAVRADAHARVFPALGRLPLPTLLWTKFGHPGFAVVNTDRLPAYQALGIPPTVDSESTLTGVRQPLQFLSSLVLAVGHGEMSIRPASHADMRSFSGSVLASNVGQSVVPNYALPGAFVGLMATDANLRESPAVAHRPLLFTDPYGRYDLSRTPSNFLLPTEQRYSPQAFWFGPDGTIAWMKDRTGSKIFQSEQIPVARREMTDLNLVLFRADPTAYLDLNDPQSMQSFAAVSPLTREGLSAFINSSYFRNPDTATTFLPPDRFFYAALRAGSPDNPLVQTIRGFLVGPALEAAGVNSGQINGKGYLVADTPRFSFLARPLAESMLRVNQERADLQARRQMLDAGLEKLLQRSADLLKAAEQPDIPQVDAVLLARESAAYSFLVHPILRANISGAVVSILWYLGLLVPFVFFAEKLIFGFTDIRKQLVAQTLIFLVVFGLLRLMHPAFEMIRSSFMILLGFVILLIAGGVTVLFAGKFRENMQALESLRGKAEGASVNTMGIVATAFMLGLNNMHRRKVRTGLTCGTLVLITFAMIAFTSVRTDLVETVVPLGPAPYQGLLIKKEEGRYVSLSEVFALRGRYGSQFPVSTRQFLTGNFDDWLREVRAPSLEAKRDVPGGAARSARFQSILQLEPTEPLRERIPLLTAPFWFGKKDTVASRPVIISDRLARDLGIDPARLDAGEAEEISINGGTFRVAGIFDSRALNELRDLDGQSFLPPDVLGMVDPRNDPDGAPLNLVDAPRIPAEDVVLMATGPLGITVPNSHLRVASVVIGLQDLGFRAAREMIFQYLEQTGAVAFFGLDGVASQGMRMRASSLQGLPDMIMPLIIAALTVLNTMKGSVYERRDEISVYNAVGIAPRYIFFMFFAEAFVYSVVGAVLGYLLSQGTGFVLTALDLTGGLRMTFAGPETIFASLAVIAAVFFSTLFPARTAMQIAAPSDDAGWTMPEPDGDAFAFALPFTFNPHDRLAVLAFFHRFLVDHGEGGSGRFHASPPILGCDGQDDPIPRVSSTIWLKPYDLGVSQEMIISLPHDAETGEFVARVHIERLTGTRESWMRLNRRLMGQIREQFLHWRAVGPAQKAQFFAEANRLLEEGVTGDHQLLEESHV